MKVYIVRYSCDEYSVYCDRPISAWFDRNQAKAEMAVLNEKLRKAREVYTEYKTVSRRANRSDVYSYLKEAVEEARKILSNFDPAQNDYFMEEVELYGDLKDEK